MREYKVIILAAYVFFTVGMFSGLVPVSHAVDDVALPGRRPPVESGFMVGYGVGNVAEGGYEPMFLLCHLGYDVTPRIAALKDAAGTLSIFVEPQIVPVFNRETNIEFGVGLGVKYRYPLSEMVSYYALLSVGPHYVTVDTTDQANGFIFSDTIGLGLAFFLSETFSFNMEYRLRHMSNAGLDSPNRGINTHNVLAGVSFFF